MKDAEAEGVRCGPGVRFETNLLCAGDHAWRRAEREPGRTFVVYGQKSSGTVWVRDAEDKPPKGAAVYEQVTIGPAF